MSRKDFIAIARALRDARPLASRESSDVLRGAHDAIDNVARELADVMRASNPRFDRAKFLDACGVAE